MIPAGCDDVADVRGTTALGGGSEKDIVDGILTLPAAIAMRDPETALLLRDVRPETFEQTARRLRAALPEAEFLRGGLNHWRSRVIGESSVARQCLPI